MSITFIIVLLPLIIIVVLFFDRMMQSTDDYKDKIIAELNSKGYILVDIAIPKIFDIGTFPKFQIKFQPIQTEVLGVSGEKTRYRIIKYKNQNGILKEAWIKIYIVAFVVTNIEWKPEL